MRVKLNELVLLLSGDESYLVRVDRKDFNTKSGIIKLHEIIGKKFGEKIKTHLGKEFTIIKPKVTDILEKVGKRVPQIIMPKDLGLILAYTGIGNNSLIVDAGTGSGYAAIFFGSYLTRGKVVTYEIDKRFTKVAKENIELSGLKNVKLKQKDITKGIDEKNVDLVNLDMKNAEKVVEHAYKALKPGGWLVVYSPNIEQVIKVQKEIKKLNFCEVKTIENIVREWKVEKYTRPKTLGIMHTGFLTFARKVG